MVRHRCLDPEAAEAHWGQASTRTRQRREQSRQLPLPHCGGLQMRGLRRCRCRCRLLTDSTTTPAAPAPLLLLRLRLRLLSPAT